MNKKQISKNMLTGLVSSGVLLLTSLLLTPYLVQVLGDEAYGYIGLANNFITGATVLTIALNSMANRFIIIAAENNDKQKVDVYFSSLFAAGAVLTILFLILGSLLTLNIEHVFNVSPNLLVPVKICFFVAILNFCAGTFFSVFGTPAFIKNRIDLASLFSLLANLAKLAFLLVAFIAFKPQIYYVTLAALVYTMVVNLGNLYLSKKLMPEIVIKVSLVDIKTIGSFLKSGFWNSLSGLVRFFSSGLDLALANWLLDGAAMGLISISTTLPVAVSSIWGAVVNSFWPSLAALYAKGDIDGQTEMSIKTTKIQCAIMVVPIAGIAIFSAKFYALWMPYKDAADINILYLLTLLKAFDQFLSVTTENMRYEFYLYNKIKASALWMLFTSAINVPLVILFVSLSKSYILSIMIIANLIVVLMIAYHWIIVPVLINKMSKAKLSVYYKMILQCFLMLITVCALFFVINNLTVCGSWFSFIAVAGLSGIFAYFIVFLFFVNKSIRQSIVAKIVQKFKKQI